MATQTESVRRYSGPPLGAVEHNTLPKLFFDAVDNRPLRSAMLRKADGQWQPISSADVARQVESLAAALVALGIQRGDRIAILSENRPEWAITDYAVTGIGAIDVPLYATLPANQIASILKDAEVAAAVVSTNDQLAKILEVRGEIPSLRHVVAFDDPGGAEGVLRFPELVADGRKAIDEGRAEDFRERAMAIAPGDVATLIYTSGTTGEPKGVMLTHFNLASNVAAVDQHNVISVSAGDVALSFLPLSHVFERLVDYFYWSHSVGIAYVESMDRIASNLVEVRPNFIVSVPRVFEKIHARVMARGGVGGVLVRWAKSVGERYASRKLAGETPSGALGFQYRLADRLVFEKLRARTGGRLRAAISGGAPLSGDIARFFFAAGIPLYEGYGLTETSPVLAANHERAVRLGTVGQPIPGTEIGIGPDGEILARGPQIMKGYWNQPEATAEAIDADGWFHTGDVGELSDDGFLTITDRVKNLLVTAGGKNIAPQPIENAILMSPYISQALLIGDRRPFPSLLIVPEYEALIPWARQQGIDTSNHDALAADSRITAFLEQDALGRLTEFAHYELPKKVAVLPSEFTIEDGELTPTLKIKRRVVEQRYADVIERIYGHGRNGG